LVASSLDRGSSCDRSYRSSIVASSLILDGGILRSCA